MAVAAAGATVAAVGTAGVVWWSPWCRVADVEVRGTIDGVNLRRALSADIVGKPLVEVDTGEVESGIAARGVFAQVDVERRWPDVVAVQAVDRVPVVGLRQRGGRVRLVDSTGLAYRVVASAPAGLPVVDVVRGRDSRALEAAAGEAADIVLAFPSDQRSRLEGLRVDDGGRWSARIGGVDITWGEAGRDSLKARVVSALIARGGIGGVDVSAPMTPATTS